MSNDIEIVTVECLSADNRNAQRNLVISQVISVSLKFDLSQIYYIVFLMGCFFKDISVYWNFNKPIRLCEILR